MSSYTKSLCGLAAAAAALSAFSGVSMAGEFDGVTVNILTRPGYVIAGRLAWLAGRIPKRLYATASSPVDGMVGR